MILMTTAMRLAACAIGVAGLLASAPAMAANHPDFSGVWTFHRASGNLFGPRWAGDKALKPEARAKVDAYHKLVDGKGESPGGWCVGTGMPGSMLGSGGYPMEIIQRPEQVTIIYEAHTELRRIYLSGANASVPDSDLFPTRNGYSTGHWEGDTLVVETKALEEQVDQAAAHSENARIVERYHLDQDENGKKLLVAELTMTDPDFYGAPVTMTKTWDAAEDGRMLYYNCNEPAWEEHLDNLRNGRTDDASSYK
jgi:hypothetical protein